MAARPGNHGQAEDRERADRDRLELAASNWSEIAEHIDTTYGE